MAADLAAVMRDHLAGRLADAERGYRAILAAEPRHAGALHLLGVLAGQSGRHAAAAASIAEAIMLQPGVAEYHASLGNALAGQGDDAAAVACNRRAVALSPASAALHFNLGNALGRIGQAEAAADSYRRALALQPDHWQVQNNLGTALKQLRRLGEATDSFRSALALRPDLAQAHLNLAAALREQGLLEQSAASCRTAIACAPELAEAHYGLAMALLPLGELAAGWHEYEWRWQTRELRGARRGFAQPAWRGEAGDGRTLLLHAEQGFGDTLQFCRYAAPAAARGWRVVLEVQPPLVRLLQCLPGAAAVVARGTALPAFAAQAPLLSLPLALGTTMASIPSATAYLRADPDAVAALGARLDAGAAGCRCVGVGVGVGVGVTRVGVAWEGNPRRAAPAGAAVASRRAIPPALLAPLAAVPGVRLFSLQKDGDAEPALNLIDLMPDMADFADTAALIANLDLVVTVDTAVAHLAAALGRPVWLLDRFDACWRWLAGRRDSPWYPTLRIYRQPSPGDWPPVIAEVTGALRKFVATAT